MKESNSVSSKKGEQKLKDLEQQVTQLTERWKRALADYTNLEKRVNQEQNQARELTTVIVVSKFLPVLDSLNKANNSVRDEGLAMIIRQFNEALSSLGVNEFGSTNDNFDPSLHEAVITDETKPKGELVEVLNKGYTINNKVIRPASVKVGSKE